jgi:hypothetical protein
LSSVTLLHRLGNHSRKNRLYKAFREWGRVVRTITLLRFLSEPDMREQITAINRIGLCRNLNNCPPACGAERAATLFHFHGSGTGCWRNARSSRKEVLERVEVAGADDTFFDRAFPREDE